MSYQQLLSFSQVNYSVIWHSSTKYITKLIASLIDNLLINIDIFTLMTQQIVPNILKA